MATREIKTFRSTGAGRGVWETVDVEVRAGAIVGPGGGSGGVVAVKNETGNTLAVNALVYVSGWDTDNELPLVTLADANAANKQAMFVIPVAIPDGNTGLAYTAFLSAANLNTNAVGSAGDPVYLSETAGGWTVSAPTAAASNVQIVGYVVVKSATVGQVSFQIGDNPTVTTDDLQADCVTGAKIADDSIDSEHYAADSIDLEHLGTDVNAHLNALRTYLADGMLAVGTITVSAGDPTDFKTTTTAIYTINGAAYTKAATDSLSFSAGDSINNGAGAGTLWGIWLVQIDAAGTISTKPGAVDMTYASEAAAIAALPAVDADNVQLGYITVQALEATDWVANTDNLTVGGGAGNCTARSFYNLPAAKALPGVLS